MSRIRITICSETFYGDAHIKTRGAKELGGVVPSAMTPEVGRYL